jgi:two-component system cell cycle sensor histidine kinase/response regulator CckA
MLGFSLVIPALMAVLSIGVGYWVISEVAFRLNLRILDREVALIQEALGKEFEVLQGAGVENLPNYVASAQQDFLVTLRSGNFETTGQPAIYTVDGYCLSSPEGLAAAENMFLGMDLAHGDKGHLAIELDGTDYFCVYRVDPVWNWTIAQILPLDTLYAQRRSYLQIVLLVSIVILTVSITLSMVFSRQVADRIDRTLAVVSLVGSGDFTDRLGPPKETDEIAELQDGIDTMSASLEASGRQLRISEEKFRSLVEVSSDWIWEIDPNGRYTYASPRCRALLGFHPSELLGKTPFDIMPPEEADRIAPIVLECMENHQPIQNLINKNIHKDGHEVFLETSGVPLFDRHGRLKGYRGVDRDITNRIREQERQQDLQGKIQHAQKLESLGVLAGGIAHDFNNLLLAVLGNADLALLDLPTTSPARECVEDIKSATLRATELAGQMLAYSGKGKFEVQVVDLSELVQEMGRMLEVSITKKAVLRYHFPENLPPVKIDMTQIRQVMMNLMTNASDAIGDRSGYIAISTGLTTIEPGEEHISFSGDELAAGPYVTLEVADTGCGMDDDTLARIFDPFFTTKFTGRGLGMAALQGIIRGDMGDIVITSTLGEGTTVKVLLPAVDAELFAPELRSVPEEELPPGTILLVDDDDSVRTIARRLMERFGMTVITAIDGIDALEVFERECERIDGVVLDLTMPRMDGVETFIKLQKAAPGLPVVITSGYSETEAAERFHGQDVTGFLKKPFQIEALKEMLRRILGDEALS